MGLAALVLFSLACCGLPSIDLLHSKGIIAFDVAQMISGLFTALYMPVIVLLFALRGTPRLLTAIAVFLFQTSF